MDTGKCRALIEALEAGNLSVAAEKLGYTPSGMSRLVASMEQELGLELLTRGRAGVRATPECELLMPVFAQMVAAGRALDETAAMIRGADIGTVRVGTAYPQYYGSLARVISGFGREHPQVSVDLSFANSTPLAAKLRAREIDFCIMSKRDVECCWIPLMENEVVVLASVEHPFAKLDTVPAQLLERESFVEVFPGQESDNSRVLAACGVVPNVRFSVYDTDAAHEMVAANLGVTLMNGLYARADERIAIRPLEPRTVVEIGVAMPNDDVLTPAVKAFADYALPCLSQL